MLKIIERIPREIPTIFILEAISRPKFNEIKVAIIGTIGYHIIVWYTPVLKFDDIYR